MSETSIKCPKCNNTLNGTAIKKCPYCGCSIKSNNKNFLSIACYIMGFIMLAIGIYMTYTYFDFVKFNVMFGAIASSVVFFSLGKALDYLKQILNKR